MSRRKFYGDETRFLEREPKLKSELPKKERKQPKIQTYQAEPFTEEEKAETRRQKDKFSHKPVSEKPLAEKTSEPTEKSMPVRSQRDEMKTVVPPKLGIRRSKKRR